MTLPERAASGDAAVLSATFSVLPYFSPVATGDKSAKKGQSQSKASRVVETMTLYCFDLLLAADASNQRTCQLSWGMRADLAVWSLAAANTLDHPGRHQTDDTHAENRQRYASWCLYLWTDIVAVETNVVTEK